MANNAKKEKAERNKVFADRYRQKRCERCKHRSSKPGRCRVCSGKMM